MNDKVGLDNLKPEVREAAKYCDEIFDGSDNGEWTTIRAELLRLAAENAGLRDRESKLWSSVDNAQLRAFIEKHGAPHPLIERAERAEAANRDCVAHFEQMRAERDQAQAELAALKRRIAEAPDATLTYRGKRCRLMLDDGEGA